MDDAHRAPPPCDIDDRIALVIPIVVLAGATLAAVVRQRELCLVAGAIAAIAIAWGLRGRVVTRIAIALGLAAFPALAHVARLPPPDPAPTIERAIALETRADDALFTRGDTRSAIALLEQAVATRACFRTLHKLAMARLALGDRVGAAHAFRAAEQQAGQQTALYMQGLAWLSSGRQDLALAALDIATDAGMWIDGDPRPR